jgi:hypothetical protein
LVAAVGAGFGDSEQNRRVEQAAVQRVRVWYEQAGWEVVSVEAQRCGFDLLCTRKGAEDRVEVKGATGSEWRFSITAAELRQARENERFVLALVTSALSANPIVTRWTADSFREEFTFEPIQYWAAAREKPVPRAHGAEQKPSRRRRTRMRRG